jgi:hypothetical protein
MRFRTFILFILLLSQPLAAFELNCGMPMHDAAVGATVSDEHCSGHANIANDSLSGYEQSPDQQQPAGHATSGGHCQLCASGAFVLPVVTLVTVGSLTENSNLPVVAPAPQFQARPLFRPPIL